MGRAKKMPHFFAQGVVHLLTAGGLIRVRGQWQDHAWSWIASCTGKLSSPRAEGRVRHASGRAYGHPGTTALVNSYLMTTFCPASTTTSSTVKLGKRSL
jgi:hypothetical protein